MSSENLNSWLSRIFTNPWVLAIVFAGIIIAVLPLRLDKYTLEIFDQQMVNESQNHFLDLDGDGISEWIELGKNYHSDEFPYLLSRTNLHNDLAGQQLHQINFRGMWIEDVDPMFGDFDVNGKSEVYFLATSSDSLFLMGVDPFLEDGVFLEKFITKVEKREDTWDFQTFNGGLYDMDDNGFKEVIFSVVAGYALSPRKIYSYDIFHDQLSSSNTNHMGLSRGIELFKYQPSGMLITSSCYAPGNIDPGVVVKGYSDRISWLVAFDKDLNFLFPPRVLDSIKGAISPFFIQVGGEQFILARYYDHNNRNNLRLLKFNLKGELLKEKYLKPDEYSAVHFRKLDGYKGVTFSMGDGKRYVSKLNTDLDFIDPIEVPRLGEIKSLDLDKNGVNEYFSRNPIAQTVSIFRNNFSFPATAELNSDESRIIPSVLKTVEGLHLLVVQAGVYLHFYTYSFNDLYYFKYPMWLVIYLFFALTFHFVFKYQRTLLKRRYETEKRMSELELLTIKNQIDPHFIINAINSMGAVIFKSKEEKQQSYKFLVNLTSLIRDTLQNSQKVSVTLKEELDFVENYLQLQRYRYQNSFEFEIINQFDHPEEIEIPKMIIQTFAENAVKHGLAHKTNGMGKIIIEVYKENGLLRIIVTDNGIGRKKASEVSLGSTGKGMEIIDQIIELYNRLKKTTVSFGIIDLVENDWPAGTKVEINIHDPKDH